MMEPSSNFKSLIATDSIKPIAVTGKARLPSSPNIPTVEEAGLPGFTASLWYGLWVPKDTPKDIVEKLNVTLREVLADPRCESGLTTLASRSRRATGSRRKPCGCFRRSRRNAGGRSSRRPTSRWNDVTLACAAKALPRSP